MDVEKETQKINYKESRIGVENTMCNGMTARIIAYRSSNDLDVQFEDGAVAEHKTWRRFQDGLIGHPSKHADQRVGLRHQMNCGAYCTIVQYRSANDIDVKFDNGCVLEHKTFDAFKRGIISSGLHHVGEVQKQNCGVDAELIQWNSSVDVVIRFEDDGAEKHTVYRYFKEGKVGHPHIKFTTYRKSGGAQHVGV